MRQTILRRIISERVGPDEGWGDPTPQYVQAAAITEVKGFLRRNGLDRTDHAAARRSHARAETTTEDIAKGPTEKRLQAFPLDSSRRRKIAMPDSERTMRIRTEGADRPAV